MFIKEPNCKSCLCVVSYNVISRHTRQYNVQMEQVHCLPSAYPPGTPNTRAHAQWVLGDESFSFPGRLGEARLICHLSPLPLTPS